MLVLGSPGPEPGAVTALLDGGADGVVVPVRCADGQLVRSREPVVPGRAYEPVAGALDEARGRGRVLLEVRNLPGEPDFDAPAERVTRMLLDLLRDRAGDDVVVASFDWFAIAVARGSVPTGFLTPPGLAAAANLAYVVENGHAECLPHVETVFADPGVVTAAHEAGVRVVCWPVEDAAEAAGLRRMGVDGIVTNLLL